MKKKKSNKGIRFRENGTPEQGFQNRRKILVVCARKAGIPADMADSPYLLTEGLVGWFGLSPIGDTKRDRFEWLVDWLIEKYEIKPNHSSPKLTRPGFKIDEFYKSWEWRRLRMKAIKKHGSRCQCCGATPDQVDVSGKPVRIVVDHIKPIRKFWDMRLILTNLQILCDECNMGKGSWDETDWR